MSQPENDELPDFGSLVGKIRSDQEVNVRIQNEQAQKAEQKRIDEERERSEALARVAKKREQLSELVGKVASAAVENHVPYDILNLEVFHSTATYRLPKRPIPRWFRRNISDGHYAPDSAITSQGYWLLGTGALNTIGSQTVTDGGGWANDRPGASWTEPIIGWQGHILSANSELRFTVTRELNPGTPILNRHSLQVTKLSDPIQYESLSVVTVMSIQQHLAEFVARTNLQI